MTARADFKNCHFKRFSTSSDQDGLGSCLIDHQRNTALGCWGLTWESVPVAGAKAFRGALAACASA